MSLLTLQLPEKAGILFEPARYKVLYGGRGSSKSWSVARALLIKGIEKPIRVLCAREYQRSIDESVHRLLSDQIQRLGLAGHYEVMRDEIRGRNGTTIFYSGLHHNTTSLKSYEGVDICWVEEGQVVSKPSWDILTPTIRAPGSEIWVTFNPELEQDETYQRFIVKPPADCLSARMLWSDNPFFPVELDRERKECMVRDPVGYQTIWQGKCRRTVEGAIYAEELERARNEDRITLVRVDSTMPVHTAWDLGILDPTAIWFFQVPRSGELRFVDYYEDNDEPMPEYLRVLGAKGYLYGRHYVPHDISKREFGTGKTSEEVAAALGWKLTRVPDIGLEQGIAAVKMAFERMVFDAERCAVGLQRLAHYRRAYNVSMGEFKPVPVHDTASHGSDAIRYAVVGYAPSRISTDRPRREHVQADSATGWMGA